MVTVSVTIEGLEKAGITLKQIKRVLTAMKPVYATVGEYLLVLFGRDVFESEGAVIGHPWKALNPGYALHKSTRYPGRGILEATGTMRHGFRALSTNDYLAIRNPVEYFDAHQNGVGVPQRVMVDLKDQQKKKLSSLITDELVTAIRRTL